MSNGGISGLLRKAGSIQEGQVTPAQMKCEAEGGTWLDGRCIPGGGDVQWLETKVPGVYMNSKTGAIVDMREEEGLISPKAGGGGGQVDTELDWARFGLEEDKFNLAVMEIERDKVRDEMADTKWSWEKALSVWQTRVQQAHAKEDFWLRENTASLQRWAENENLKMRRYEAEEQGRQFAQRQEIDKAQMGVTQSGDIMRYLITSMIPKELVGQTLSPSMGPVSGTQVDIGALAPWAGYTGGAGATYVPRAMPAQADIPALLPPPPAFTGEPPPRPF